MNRQRVILLVLLGAFGVFYVGDLAYRTLYAEPLAAELRKTKPLENKLFASKVAVREEQR